MDENQLVFQDNGYLPPGIHSVTLAGFEDFFAKTIPDKHRRQQLFMGYKTMCDTMQRFGIMNFTHWIGGSFTTSKEFPGDIDVVLIVDYDEFDNVPNEYQELFLKAFHMPTSKELYYCDAYMILAYPKDSMYYTRYIEDKQYWLDWWGHTREKNSRGFIELIYGRGARYE